MDFTNSSPWNTAAYNELKNLGPSSLGDWVGPNGEFQNADVIFTPGYTFDRDGMMTVKVTLLGDGPLRGRSLQRYLPKKDGPKKAALVALDALEKLKPPYS